MKIYRYILTLWVQIRDLYLYFFRHAIIVNGYVDNHTWKGIRHRNWGDDLNYYMIRELTGRPVIFYHNFILAKWFHMTNYMCIGTILDNKTTNSRCNNKTIVWGTGCVGVYWNLPSPLQILAIRGLKTQYFLKQNGLSCPAVYGDPALLLPLIYQPKDWKVQGAGVQKMQRYKVGIIPHVVDQQHPVIQEIREKYADEVLVIDLANYKRWTDVIDQICSCEKILSSSLHGLIVSDAYQIPNCWIELTGKISGGYFKYHDYASSVHREFTEPARIELVEDLFSLTTACAQKDIILKLQKDIIDCCPFHLKSIT